MNSRFNYGSVLKVTRHDTLEDIEKIFIQMSESGFNACVIWPATFWWEEKTELYPFATGLKILDLAQKHNIKLVMELAGQLTSMEYAPDFLMKDEFNAVDENGARLYGQSSFGYLNYFHPELKEIICTHFAKAAETYKDHPALLAYDIFNETMFRSFDKYTMDAFRNWLKEKYGTIEKLNVVWERTYTDFSQISYEKWKWMSIMPEADYNAFRRDSIKIILKDWYDAVRSADSVHPIMADNIYSQISPIGMYGRPQDDFGLKEVCDEIGMSFYPKQINGTFEPALRHEIFDGFYTAAKRDGFWIAEMQTHIQAIFNFETCVTVNDLKQWCLEGYSSGAKSLIYWMWRPFDKGLQTMGRGLVNYQGKSTERLTLATEMGKIFSEIGVIKPVRAQVGILYDKLCEDFERLLCGSYKGFEANVYNMSVFGAYKAFMNAGIHCDIVTEDEISNYKVLVLTNHLVISDQTAKVLSDFVKNGGVIIADGHLGMTDRESQVHRVLPGGALNSLVGEKLFDYDNFENTFKYGNVEVKGCTGRQIMDVTDATVVSEFDDGLPAVVKKDTEKGSILTFNTMVWDPYGKDANSSTANELAKVLADEFNIDSVKCDLDVTVRISENEKGYYLFVFNYSDKEQAGKISINYPVKHEFDVKVSAGDVVILSFDREA